MAYYTAPYFFQSFTDASGNPATGGSLQFFVTRTDIAKAVYTAYDGTVAATTLNLNLAGQAPQYWLGEGLYKIVVLDNAGNTVKTYQDIAGGGGGGSSYPTPSATGYLYYNSVTGTYSWQDINAVDTYTVKCTATDAASGYLADKLVGSSTVQVSPTNTNGTVQLVLTSNLVSDTYKVIGGDSGSGFTAGYLNTKFGDTDSIEWHYDSISDMMVAVVTNNGAGKVSADGTDAADYLINKLASADASIDISVVSGKVNLGIDYTTLKAGLSNTPYAVWFSDSNGELSGSSNLTYGDPNHGGNSILYSQNFLAGSNFVINGRGFNALSDGTLDLQFPTNGARVKIAVQDRVGDVYGTAFISAHNNANTASIVTDRASFANLANNGIVFAAMLPNTAEDLIYLHTATGLSYNPTSNLLTTPSLAVSNLSSAGVLVNDASGNISSVTAGTFTDDHLVFVDSLDTTPGYLGTKLAAGTNIGFSVTSDSHGHKLWISARSNMLLNPTYVTANYTVIDTDMCVVAQTNSNITITLPTPGTTYNGRGLYVYSTGTGTLTINTVSGGILGYTPGFKGYGKQMFRCLKGSDNNYYWICGA